MTQPGEIRATDADRPARGEERIDEWVRCMRRGDLTAAWEISDRVLAERRGATSWHLPRHEQWVWNGEALNGRRVLIRCYHGLGDTIQFARFFPIVNELAESSAVWVQPSLIPLLRTVPGIGELHPLHDGTPNFAYDLDIESMELAHAFRATHSTLPSVPYLHVDSASVPRRHANEKRIGIVREAGEWDPDRSIPMEVVSRLFDLPDATFYSLQRDASETHRDLLQLEGVDDPLSTARLMRGLDLVISVDTMTAHLAGALGVPVFTLLPKECDWRWMEERTDSPWYPTMRLFRQQRTGEWDDVIDAVRYAIAMADETKKRVSDSLRDWGIDVDRFEERAKESLGAAKGDLSEVTGTLRQALVHARDVVTGLQTAGSPAAAELKGGFERAWQEIERAFKSAREKAREAKNAGDEQD